MNIKCPKCRYEHSLRDAMREGNLEEVIKMMGDFAPHHALVFEYVKMFDTVKPIKDAKLLRLLKEIQGIWNTGEFSHYKTPYTISKDGIVAALKVVCNKKLDLENHNYLVKVMIGIAEQETEKRNLEDEQALRKKEEGLKSGVRPGETVRVTSEVPKAFKEFFKGK